MKTGDEMMKARTSSSCMVGAVCLELHTHTHTMGSRFVPCERRPLHILDHARVLLEALKQLLSVNVHELTKLGRAHRRRSRLADPEHWREGMIIVHVIPTLVSIYTALHRLEHIPE